MALGTPVSVEPGARWCIESLGCSQVGGALCGLQLGTQQGRSPGGQGVVSTAPARGGAAVLALPVVTLEERGRQGKAGPFHVFPKRGRQRGFCFSNTAGDLCLGAWARGRRRADSATPRPVCDLWCQLSWSRLSGKSWNTPEEPPADSVVCQGDSQDSVHGHPMAGTWCSTKLQSRILQR